MRRWRLDREYLLYSRISVLLNSWRFCSPQLSVVSVNDLLVTLMTLHHSKVIQVVTSLLTPVLDHHWQ